jgi:hypothetical protein
MFNAERGFGFIKPDDGGDLSSTSPQPREAGYSSARNAAPPRLGYLAPDCKACTGGAGGHPAALTFGLHGGLHRHVSAGRVKALPLRLVIQVFGG